MRALGLVIWLIRSRFWNRLGWIKMRLNRPLDIPLPPKTRAAIRPIPLCEAVPAIPIGAARALP